MAFPGWVLDPYGNDFCMENAGLENELIELSTNEEIKFYFKKVYQHLWLQKTIPMLYPRLCNVVHRFLVAFPSSYLAERGFIACATLFSKKRSRIYITERGDLSLLYLTKFEPDVEKTMKRHQIHPSH
ncbi:hypothetical protein ENBRE01_3271 [Enteropsectra breve]|nr:hypothetical protein ENBRE01_3271 [Enteropsectra breve]